ncbi:iron ABC transporter substrate-binding protein [Asticcacaulis sp. 201]|uniref:iron ABC transporter substrate-binding protein n=1 Tax=Asticcacaulis sp. 201 TaxID=3028787 RepID=UPI002915D236|nr:iron ABC transporter substrate-binding protein [Asticcacaulis sp. 201]MDV6329240.1 iron ABC transporter substrate-binding protein [Asticcacaulis sp. 201]
MLAASLCVTGPAVSRTFAPKGDVRALTVVSLDMCADQYVLGLVPRDQILALSERSALPDSNFRERAEYVRRIKPRIESILALNPDVVVRTWGGDLNLIKALERRHIKIININDISNYDQAKSELFRVGHELDQEASAQIEARRFDLALADIQPLGRGRSILYYTPSGYSAGPDTMTGDMLRRLGFKLETQDKGYFYLSPEVLLSKKPDVFALAFYDDAYAMRRVPGRNPLIRARIADTPHIVLPRQALSCNGWFTAYDLVRVSKTPIHVGSGKAGF